MTVIYFKDFIRYGFAFLATFLFVVSLCSTLISCTPKCLKTPKSIEICLNRPPSIFCGMQVCIVYHSHLLTGIKFRTCRIVPYHFGQWCFVICCFSFLLFFFLQQSSESERTPPNVVPPKHDEYVCYICI